MENSTIQIYFEQKEPFPVRGHPLVKFFISYLFAALRHVPRVFSAQHVFRLTLFLACLSNNATFCSCRTAEVSPTRRWKRARMRAFSLPDVSFIHNLSRTDKIRKSLAPLYGRGNLIQDLFCFGAYFRTKDFRSTTICRKFVSFMHLKNDGNPLCRTVKIF